MTKDVLINYLGTAMAQVVTTPSMQRHVTCGGQGGTATGFSQFFGIPRQ